jgi:thymidylate synthase ThyX
MQSGKMIYDPYTNNQLNASYKAVMEFATEIANDMYELGAAKEQCNRVIPQIKMVRGIVTGTEDAWKAFLTLRNNANADTATQKLAQMIQNELIAANWEYANDHTPFFNDGDTVESAIARIARVSYNREKGKNDKELHDRLLKDGHYSVFEHMACWQYNPLMSNLTCKRGDVFVVQETNDPYLSERWYKQDYEGWRSYRSALEV